MGLVELIKEEGCFNAVSLMGLAAPSCWTEAGVMRVVMDLETSGRGCCEGLL